MKNVQLYHNQPIDVISTKLACFEITGLKNYY